VPSNLGSTALGHPADRGEQVADVENVAGMAVGAEVKN
jgi:hypothetical protein